LLPPNVFEDRCRGTDEIAPSSLKDLWPVTPLCCAAANGERYLLGSTESASLITSRRKPDIYRKTDYPDANIRPDAVSRPTAQQSSIASISDVP